MVSLRSIWIGVAIYLTIAAVLAPLPLLGCAGGLTKLIMYMNSGPIFKLHLLLLLGYAGLYHLKIVKGEQLKIPVRISTFGCVAIALPALLCLATCSPQFLQEEATQPAGLVASLQLLITNIPPNGWSISKWTGLAMPCPNLEGLHNITTTYRTNLPVRGPSSDEAPYMNSFTTLLMAKGLGSFNQTELNTYFFPVPEHHQKNSNKNPGILIFVHGGGWYSGAPTVPPGGCHAAFAHSNGWAYAAVEYRLGRTGWSGDSQLQDVKDAIRHVLKVHGKREFDPSKVIVIGSSAGAHLSLAASYQLNNEKASLKDPMIAGVIAIAPSTSVELGMSSDESVQRWRGAWSEAEATKRLCQNVKGDCHKKLSPVEHVTKYTPPTIVLHGQQDEYYAAKHSRILMDKLAQHKIPHVHLEAPLMPHCLELAENSIPYQMVRSASVDLMKSLYKGTIV